jgi:signal-transduction protein with cAMP-binding, CBS, and nucleotidyltransferase domain
MSDRHALLPEKSAVFVEGISRQVREYMLDLDRAEAEALLGELRQRVEEESTALATVADIYADLLARVAGSCDYRELAQIHSQLNELEIARFEAIPSVPALHYACTNYRNLLVARILFLVESEMAAKGEGPPPLPYALLSMGSDGRLEQTLITDQDYLLVYANGGDERCDAYFAALSCQLVERLAEVGFKKCTGEIMPSNPTWRGSVQQWNRRILAIVRYEFDEYAKNLMDLIVLSDARYVAGVRTLADALVEVIRDFERSYFQVIWGMAKAATNMKVGLSWFGRRLWTEKKGPHQGELNIKLLGWAPLVMNVRILAVNSNILETSTLQRIDKLESARSFSPEFAAGLRGAYLLLTRLRICLQIRELRGLQEDSYFLNPQTLTVQQQDELRQALRRIEELQKIIHTNFTIV